MTDGLVINPYRFGAPAPDNLTWTHRLWAGDPLWSNPGDGNPVSSWRNASGGGDPAMTGSNRPTFRASVAAYNNKPAIEFVAASFQVLDFDIANLAQPYSIIIVGNTGGANGATERLLGTGVSTATGLGDAAAGTWNANFGSSVTGGTTDANPHLFRVYASGASSLLDVDGVNILATNFGTNQLQRLTLGTGANSTPAFSNFLNGKEAFVGVAAGDVTAQAGWATFKAWVTSEYGITVA